MIKVFEERLKKHKLIAAIKEPRSIEKAIKYKDHISAVILMTGTILNVKQYVDVLQSEGLPVILHVEKIGGLQVDQHGIDIIVDYVKPFAIVTTKSSIIKRAKSKGMFVIQRVFLIDTEVYDHLLNSLEHLQSDIIEIMPSRAPDFLEKLSEVSPVPVITGGLLATAEHAKEALERGAAAVTTSNTKLWKLDFNHL
ncbi:glycerol uptake operon antiterminator regulatory protein [Siminovitchia terrae]|uniref:Glycerol uptake operon antiterminator regulatory protein n=1 Tax=Siminovitchia terrae TaxID=1914933 RepID=A0A429X1X2_SIMTE|nr:glycerol-3-phosphate responsive antiterminator [Siminovitchia terrae]RST57432.1 glycerol-3-phosphate responsive antiterminator [Siminovitchia terrae]GIN89421.1 glycerol uptake operon antiterminator regulatory protein [Siminovitchia terrae]GIN98160.1 glycerol uptake operon antiterminator regulatory protein [Siminovitchia terrae]